MAVSNVELRVGATQAITALKNVNTQAQKFNQTVNGTNSKLKDANKALPIIHPIQPFSGLKLTVILYNLYSSTALQTYNAFTETCIKIL